MLHFEAPPFGEAAESIYRQGQLFDVRPEQSDTGFDLLGDVLTDIRSKAENSLRFDDGLLRRVGTFGSYPARQGVDRMVVPGDRFPPADPPRLDAELSRLAKELQRRTPSPTRARITGKLDMIRDHDNVFELILEDSATVRGIWQGGDIAALTPLFQRDVVIEGQAVFRVSGNLLRIEADAIRAATGSDDFFRKLPVPSARQTEQRHFHRPQGPQTGANAIRGRWPGEESEEEILAALKEVH